MPKYLINVRTNQPILLTELIASSGEGEVWATENIKILAKVYHSPTFQRQEKLRVMIKHPPRDPNQHLNCISFAWPQSLLLDPQSSAIVGFLMPAVRGGKELIEIYNPSRRRKKGLQVDWYFLHTAAHNIASIIHSIHEAGYVLGDIKPQNILINNQAIPSIIDTDSFQVKNPLDGEVYRCLVGSEGFTPPELLGKDFAQIDQHRYHDYFRIGVIIYFLLFGTHPFQGRWVGQGDSPELTELIRQGYWVFAPQGLIRPSRLTISLSTLYPALQDCFIRCFSEGHRNPQVRPTAAQWQVALKSAIKGLVNCSEVKYHYYHQDSDSCYWCKRAEQLKTDVFSGQKLQLKSLTSPSVSSSHLTPGYFPFPSSLFANTSYAKVQRQISFRPVMARKRLNQQGLLLLSYAFLPFFVGSLMIVIFLSLESPSPSPPVAVKIPTPEALPVTRSANFYNQEGYENYLKGNSIQAIASFDQAIKMNPKFAEAYYNRSLVKQSLGYQEEAQQDSAKAIFLDPKIIEKESETTSILPRLEPSQESILASKNHLPAKEDDGVSTKNIDLEADPQSLEIFPKNKVGLPLPSQPKPPKSSKTYPTNVSVKPTQNKQINPQSLGSEIESYGLKRQLYNSLKAQNTLGESSINPNLALSFYQQGLAYRNLGMYSEAIDNVRQSSFLLKKEGNKELSLKVDTFIKQMQKENQNRQILKLN